MSVNKASSLAPGSSHLGSQGQVPAGGGQPLLVLAGQGEVGSGPVPPPSPDPEHCLNICVFVWGWCSPENAAKYQEFPEFLRLQPTAEWCLPSSIEVKLRLMGDSQT